MKYYSEEEARKRFRMFGHSETHINDILRMWSPADLPTSSDRERIRMELWNSTYLHYIKTQVNSLAAQMATTALEAFDKKFPNS